MLLSWALLNRGSRCDEIRNTNGTDNGDGLMRHELHKTFLCARSAVVLLGNAGKYVPRAKQPFLHTGKPKYEKYSDTRHHCNNLLATLSQAT